METIFCVNCEYYEKRGQQKKVCTHGQSFAKKDLVTGEGVYWDCYHMRSFNGFCGPDGKLFVEKHKGGKKK